MDYVDALDKLIDAYRKIADSLPSLDRLSSALKDNHDFQAVLADLYGDILEFHRYAYKFVTRRCMCEHCYFVYAALTQGNSLEELLCLDVGGI